MKICSNCGNVANDNDKYCINCGSQIKMKPEQYKLHCPRCSSQKIDVRIVPQTISVQQSHSTAYWIFIGWWLEILLWVFLFIPRLLIAIFVPKKQKVITYNEKILTCQNCGFCWKDK